jgi:spore coat polysaccharide biosynthesis predicted glycosyltransferase SpsG
LEKKILFRVDAGGKVGLGHFYRSYNLALALKKNNYIVTFVHLKSTFWDSVKDFEFRKIELDDNNPNKHMFDICLKEKFKVLYVDGILEFNEANINKLEGKTKIVFYQNISESRHLADVFILPSIHYDKSFFKKFNILKTQIFQGLEYFTFNTKISNLPTKQVSLKSNVKEIGIICGGSDPRNAMMRVFELIDFTKWGSLDFNFYYGVNYMHTSSIPKVRPDNVKFIPYNINNINKSDLLIAAFGVSTYEFMVLGMPIISVGHQEANANASKILAKKTKSIYHLGLIDSITEEILNKTIGKLVKGLKINKKLSDKSKKLLDLKGIDRIVKIIENI